MALNLGALTTFFKRTPAHPAPIIGPADPQVGQGYAEEALEPTPKVGDSLQLVDVFALVEPAVVLNDGHFVRALEIGAVDLETGQPGLMEAFWARFADALRRFRAPFTMQIVVSSRAQDIHGYLEQLRQSERRWLQLAEEATQHDVAERRRRRAAMTSEHALFVERSQVKLCALQQRYLVVLRHNPFHLKPSSRHLLAQLDGAVAKAAFEVLDDDVRLVRHNFEPLGLPVTELSAHELCRALWDHYHPALSGVGSQGEARDLLTSEIWAGHEDRSPSPAYFQLAARDSDRLADLLAPDHIEEHPDYLRVGEAVAKAYLIEDFDPKTPVNVSQLLNFPGEVTHALFFTASSPDVMKQKFKEKETELKASQHLDSRNHRVTDYGRQMAVRSIEAQRAAMEIALEAPYTLHWTCLVWAKDVAQLKKRCNQFESRLKVRDFRYQPAVRRHLRAFQSARPLARWELQAKGRNMTADSLGSCFPFVRRQYMDPQGIDLGVHRGNGLLVTLDDMKDGDENANSFVCGAKGMGKSVLLKLRIAKWLLMGHRVFVIDPEREYFQIAVDFHGRYLELGKKAAPRAYDLDPGSEDSIQSAIVQVALVFESNAGRKMEDDELGTLAEALVALVRQGQSSIKLADLVERLRQERRDTAQEVGRVLAYALDLDGGFNFNVMEFNLNSEDPWRSAAQSLAAFVEVAQGSPISHGKFNALVDSYVEVMTRAGFTPGHQGSWEERRAYTPRLEALVDRLSADRLPESQELARLLKQYARGLYADLFNVASNVDIHKDQFVVFGLRTLRENVEKSLAPVFTWQILRLVWNEIIATGGAQPIHLVLDEGWFLTEIPGAAERLEAFSRSFRKHLAALHFATQEIDKMMTSTSTGVIANLARIKLLLGVESDRAARSLADVFGLSDDEAAGLRTARPGEALLIAGSEMRVPLYIPANPDWMSRMRTNKAQQLALSRSSGRTAEAVL